MILVVDQMRVDYLQWYAANYSAGFSRLMREGAWFTEAAYPYLNTITCAGHSTIGTGSFPYRHGMILNNWFDPKTGKSPYCTDDPTVTEISYNHLSPVQGDSGKLMLVPAHRRADHESWRPQRGALAQAAIGRDAHRPQGHGRRLVRRSRRLDDVDGVHARSPYPFLQAFIDANPMNADYDKSGSARCRSSAYQGEDEMKGEGKVTGWTDVLPASAGRGRRKGRFGFLLPLAEVAVRRRIPRAHGRGVRSMR